MRCETFLDRYDLLDAGEEPGMALRLHLARCPSCRDRVAAMDAALAAYREEAADEAARLSPEAERLEDHIMAAVRLLPKPKRELHANDWAMAGLVLLGALALIPFDANFGIIKAFFGTSYSLPFALVVGVALTVFGTVFIATHMDELEPLLKRRAYRA